MISVPTSCKNCKTVYMTQVSKNVFLMLTTYIYLKTALCYMDNFSTTLLQQSGKSMLYEVHAVNSIKFALCERYFKSSQITK
jgi:hypothetical protein